ncbi:MAG: (d)CMP kinase [Myxococcales bacterium]|nr:(d)CMP kinase [Myxococcales bacterium]
MIEGTQTRRLVVAIDGPAGAGKSTLANELARALGYLLLDTGALYRAIALAAERAAIAWDDAAGVGAVAQRIAQNGELALEAGPRGVRVVLLGEDVSPLIRTAEISMGASRVSAIPEVREALLELQRASGRTGGVIAEGRDIGTVVFPHAEVKFFVTASVDVRAERRFLELCARGDAVSRATVRSEIMERDRQDTERAVAPLRQADDARLIDTSTRAVTDLVLELAQIVRDVAER